MTRTINQIQEIIFGRFRTKESTSFIVHLTSRDYEILKEELRQTVKYTALICTNGGGPCEEDFIKSIEGPYIQIMTPFKLLLTFVEEKLPSNFYQISIEQE